MSPLRIAGTGTTLSQFCRLVQISWRLRKSKSMPTNVYLESLRPLFCLLLLVTCFLKQKRHRCQKNHQLRYRQIIESISLNLSPFECSLRWENADFCWISLHPVFPQRLKTLRSFTVLLKLALISDPAKISLSQKVIFQGSFDRFLKRSIQAFLLCYSPKFSRTQMYCLFYCNFKQNVNRVLRLELGCFRFDVFALLLNRTSNCSLVF